jgi:competence protein ComEC
VTVLHAPDPLPDEKGGLRAGDVAILRVDYGQTCLLLAASAGAEAERAMLAQDLPPGVRCDVLQVGRHGSEAASTAVFLEAVRPALAVISAGEGNRAGDPDERTLARLSEVGATVLRTDEVGSVEAISDGVGVEVRVGR